MNDKKKTVKPKININIRNEAKLIKKAKDDIPFDPPFKEIENYDQEITNIFKSYVICDQTKLLEHALWTSEIMQDFELSDVKNSPVVWLSSPTNWYLIANNFAHELEKHGELILANSCGTWWGANITKDNPINKNKAMIEIVKDIRARDKNIAAV